MSADQSSKQPGSPSTGDQPYERNRAVTWIGLAVIGLLLLAYLLLRRPPGGDQGTKHPAAGQPVLFFELEPLTDASTAISKSELRDKVTLVNLWGTWCGPCEEEFPYLAAIYERFKGHSDFRFVSVSYPGEPGPLSELQEATTEFLTRQRAKHVTYHDPGGQTAGALAMIGVSEVFPTTVVIDGAGIVRGVWQGYNRASMREIEELVDQLLGE